MQIIIGEHERLIAQIDRLCAEICDTAHGADWDAAGRLLSRRHRLLENLFGKTPTTAVELVAMRELGDRIILCDRELAAMAAAAQRVTRQELALLHKGRRATAAYADHD